MKTLIFIFILLLASGAVAQNGLIKSKRPVKNSYIVVLKDGVDAKIESAGKNPKFIFDKVLNGYVVSMSEKQATALSKNPKVKYIEEDSTLSLAGATSVWNLDRIDQRNLPLDGFYNPNYTGQGVTAFIIDSGINLTHQDFTGRIVGTYDNIGGNGSDCIGHGTHVAGIIGGTTYGVAKNISLYPERIVDCAGNIQVSNMIDAMNFAVSTNIRPAVMNISISGAGSSPSVTTAVDNAVSSGIFVAVASGNGGYDACAQFPGNAASAMTVGGATDNLDEYWPGADGGACVDILAPGLFVDSDWIGSDTAIHNDGGTSMASPHVAGAAALYYQNRPQDSVYKTQKFLIDNSTANVITGVPAGTINKYLFVGFDTSTVAGCSGSKYGGAIEQGQTLYYPSINGFSGGTGIYSAQLGSFNQIRMTLEAKKGQQWNMVATSIVGSINYTGKSATYRWKLVSEVGGGAFDLCTMTP